MRLVLIERPDGGVSIMQMVETADGGAEIAKWEAGSGARVVGWYEVGATDLPSDRTFREAWTHIGAGKCAVDMSKARSLQMDRIRASRDAELAKLDGPAIRALEQGDADAMAEIARQKQRLRDIPQTFNLTQAETPEALAAIWPAGLPSST